MRKRKAILAAAAAFLAAPTAALRTPSTSIATSSTAAAAGPSQKKVRKALVAAGEPGQKFRESLESMTARLRDVEALRGPGDGAALHDFQKIAHVPDIHGKACSLL